MTRASLHTRVSQAVIESVRQLENTNRIWVAYSGGIDSHVLLHVLGSNRHEFHDIDVRAVYINHGLNPRSDQWSEHCQKVCDNLAINFVAIDVDATPLAGESPEAKARQARYAALEKLVQSQECLLTAHHQDDQVETLLLQLIRGSGPKGLAAMPSNIKIGRGSLVRPMLEIKREEVHAYAVYNKLKWIDDDSNSDLKFDRNFIRHKVVPVLSQRWPSLSQTISRSAHLCAEAADILDGVAEKALKQLTETGDDGVDIEALQLCTTAEQRNILRHWVNKAGFNTPSRVQLERIINEVFTAKEDKSPVVKWSNCEVRRYRERLYILKSLPEIDSSQSYRWSGKNSQTIENLGELAVKRENGNGISSKLLDSGNVMIRFRVGGESIQPSGRKEHHSLKKLFQELGVPPWMRGRIPLIFIDDMLAAVESIFVDQQFEAKADEEGCTFRWIPNS